MQLQRGHSYRCTPPHRRASDLPKPGKKTRYNTETGEIEWNPIHGTIAIPHELGHWLEDNSITTKQQALKFLLRRTAGNQPRLLKEIYPNHDFTNEQYLPDDFINSYIGRIYKDLNGNIKGTEIISTALELLFTKPHLLAQADPEQFKLAYNVLRGIL